MTACAPSRFSQTKTRGVTRDAAELMIRVERLEITLEYIASVAAAYSTDESMGKRFAAIRDTALEMVNDDGEENSETMAVPLEV